MLLVMALSFSGTEAARVLRLDLVESGHLAAAFQKEVHRHLRAPDLVRSHVEERIQQTFPGLEGQVNVARPLRP